VKLASSFGWAYQFCFKVCNGLRLRHKTLQEGLQEFIRHSDFQDNFGSVCSPTKLQHSIALFPVSVLKRFAQRSEARALPR
jgi:hypothetical protein